MWETNEYNYTDKTFFKPGDIVRLKHENISNRPNMLIVGKAIMSDPINGSSQLQGMRCVWYDLNQTYQEKVFSTKDLEKVQ